MLSRMLLKEMLLPDPQAAWITTILQEKLVYLLQCQKYITVREFNITIDVEIIAHFVLLDQNPTQLSTVPSTFPTDINDNDGTLTNDNINLYDYPIRGGAQEGQNLSFSIQLPTGSSNEIDYAEIRLRKACTQGDFADFSQICYADNIYATVEVYLRINTTHGIRKLFVTGRSLVLNDGKPWEEFEISEAVQQCLSLQPYKTEVHLELEIKLNPSNNLPYNIDPYKFFQNSAANLTTTTQLVVFAVSEKDIEEARRRKRQVSKEFCFANFTTNCCVRNLTINFHEDLNWTWVIAPIEYQPNYCSGDCPYLWPSATLHASALQTLKFLNPAASAEPCCVPAMLLPLTIVREDPDTGGLIFEPLSEMIVDSCICR